MEARAEVMAEAPVKAGAAGETGKYYKMKNQKKVRRQITILSSYLYPFCYKICYNINYPGGSN